MEESEDNRKQGKVGMKRIWLNYKPPFLSSLSIFQLGLDGPDMIPCHKQKEKKKSEGSVREGNESVGLGHGSV